MKDITFPAAFRTSLPSAKVEPKDEPNQRKPIVTEEYIETVVPQTPFDLLDSTTGADIIAEFQAKRREADEGVCQDALVFLKAGLGPVEVIEAVWLRWGADFAVTKTKIEQAVSMAVELLNKEKNK
jgi:hypothetical protein